MEEEEKLKELDSKNRVEGLYQKLTEIKHQTTETFYSDDFELRDGKQCYNSTALMSGEGKLKMATAIADILGEKGLRNFDLDIPSSSTGHNAEQSKRRVAFYISCS